MQNFLYIMFWSILGLVTAHFARKRGRNPYFWLFMGLFLGVIGLLLLFILPVKKALTDIPVVVKKPEDEALFELSNIDKLWYYLDAERQQLGPMSFQALKTAWNEGKVTPNTYVWNELMEDWKRVKELIGAAKS